MGEQQRRVLHGIKVLVVDDNFDARHFASEVFERFGAVVTTAPSVDKALASLTYSWPDVIVIAIALPRQDGYEFIRILREELEPRRGRKKTPAVALSEHADIDEWRRSHALGFQAHLSKPFNTEQLVHLMRQLVDLGGNAEALSAARDEFFRDRRFF